MHAKRIQGKKAQRAGSNFEVFFQSLCKTQGISFERIPSGCKSTGKNRLIRVTTPFDYILGYQGQGAVVDLKSIETGNLTYSKIVPHQLKALRNLSVGLLAGYVVGFSEDVYFMPVYILERCQPGESVDLMHCKLLGPRRLFDITKVFL
jgi:penicillin-binding protein-related factor A (putative recombinase)